HFLHYQYIRPELDPRSLVTYPLLQTPWVRIAWLSRPAYCQLRPKPPSFRRIRRQLWMRLSRRPVNTARNLLQHRVRDRGLMRIERARRQFARCFLPPDFLPHFEESFPGLQRLRSSPSAQDIWL